jgi:hypothetical protein
MAFVPPDPGRARKVADVSDPHASRERRMVDGVIILLIVVFVVGFFVSLMLIDS